MADDERYGLHRRLVDRFGERAGDALYSFGAGALAIAVSGLAAYLAGQPLIFPSLGPAAYLFFESPMSRRASPRNTLIGHLVAILVGAFSLALFGLLDDPSVKVSSSPPRSQTECSNLRYLVRRGTRFG